MRKLIADLIELPIQQEIVRSPDDYRRSTRVELELVPPTEKLDDSRSVSSPEPTASDSPDAPRELKPNEYRVQFSNVCAGGVVERAAIG